MEILITLCARGGSKGIPGKNIKPLNGIPLIAYSIKTAQKTAQILNADVSLSTDDEEIKKVASKYGIVTKYQRPHFLSSDTAGKIDTIKDILEYEEATNDKRYDYVLDLDVTSPLRTFEDINSAFNELVMSDALTIFSVNNSARNPYFNMVEKKDNGYYDLVKKEINGSVMSRQKAPKVFDLNASFYWYKRIFFELNLKSPITNKSLIFPMKHICFDLDHNIDFEFMEFLIQNNKLDFQL